MNHPCPNCNKPFSSEKKLNVHLALDHEAFLLGESISLATIYSLELKKDRVKFLLIKYPACRKPDNGDLWLYYLRYWTNAVLYDAQTQDYVMNDSNAQRNHISHHSLRWALTQLEGARRMREELQAEDKSVYHPKEGAVIKHFCILPSEVDQVRARISEKAHERYFTIEGQGGNIYVPDSQGI